jgi:hypothetical protein
MQAVAIRGRDSDSGVSFAEGIPLEGWIPMTETVGISAARATGIRRMVNHRRRGAAVQEEPWQGVDVQLSGQMLVDGVPVKS